MWSVGLIIVEMMTGKVAFETETEIEQLLRILEKRGTPNEETLKNFKNYHQLRKILPRLPKFAKVESYNFGYGLDELVD